MYVAKVGLKMSKKPFIAISLTIIHYLMHIYKQ